MVLHCLLENIFPLFVPISKCSELTLQKQCGLIPLAFAPGCYLCLEFPSSYSHSGKTPIYFSKPSTNYHLLSEAFPDASGRACHGPWAPPALGNPCISGLYVCLLFDTLCFLGAEPISCSSLNAMSGTRKARKRVGGKRDRQGCFLKVS